MKRTGCFLLILALALSLFAGCGQRRQEENALSPKNDILTYEKVDPAKTTLVASMLGNNVMVTDLAEAFEKANPDVQIICLDITGGDGAYKPIDDWIRHGETPDVAFTNDTLLQEQKNGADFLVDLSAHPVLTRFETATLDRLAQDGHIYYLPGPSEIDCLCYNKTMFDQYGWAPPATFDEFVALCLRIREDTDGAVQPWNPNAKYDSVFATALEGFTYGALFSGVDNTVWYRDFCAGKAAFTGHMEPMYDLLQTLVDNGILLEEQFTYSATTRGKEFKEGKIAMVNNKLSAVPSSGDGMEVGYTPFPSIDGEMGYVCTTYSLILCVPKKEHTPAQQDAIDRFIAYYASAEGQRVIFGDKLLISNVKDVPNVESDALKDVQAAIARGNQFAYFTFGEGNRTWTFRDNALAMVKGEKTGPEIIAEIDAKPFKTEAEAEAEHGNIIARVAEGGLSILEFSGYIADMYREKAGADIGLINHGVAYRGNLMRLFEGDIPDTYMHVLKPRSFDNDSTLIKVSMTGRQLTDALNHPGNTAENETDSVYAFSGLKCTLAPWNGPGEKVLSVKLADGSPLDMERLYTVAVWQGTVQDAYITEVLETYEGTWEELMTAKMQAEEVIAPADDGRFTLVWE